MKLSQDAKIFAPNGDAIGNLKRFVIDPNTKQITHFVLQRGLLNTEERVVPFEMIDHVDDSGIYLRNVGGQNVDDLPPFEEKDYIVTDERALANLSDNLDYDQVSSYYSNPTLYSAGTMVNPSNLYTYIPGGPPVSVLRGSVFDEERPVIEDTQENIPDGTVALKEGAKVYSSDDKHVGNLEKIFVEGESSRVSHLLISKGFLLKEHKKIPASWIKTADENTVYLAVEEAAVQRVPDYQAD